MSAFDFSFVLDLKLFQTMCESGCAKKEGLVAACMCKTVSLRHSTDRILSDGK